MEQLLTKDETEHLLEQIVSQRPIYLSTQFVKIVMKVLSSLFT